MTVSKIFVLIALVLYAVATVICLLKQTRKYGLYVCIAAVAVNIAVVAINWAKNGYVPFVSMYQVLSFLGVCFFIVYPYLKFVQKTDIPVWVFTLCSLVCMIGCVAMKDVAMKRPPALLSPYFFPHILCYMIGYSLCALSFVLTFKMLFKKDSLIKIQTEYAIYKIVLTAFPFMVAGMMLGALWANQCWGNYWSWDPKETWALITTCFYGLYLHSRKIRGTRIISAMLLILGFVSLLMTLFGVSLFTPNAVHSYSLG